jgi:hypothetical protein
MRSGSMSSAAKRLPPPFERNLLIVPFISISRVTDGVFPATIKVPGSEGRICQSVEDTV